MFLSLQQLYGNFLSYKPADINVELDVVNRLSPTEIEAAISETRFIHEGDQFKTTNLVVTGKYNLASRSVSMTLERCLLNSSEEYNVLNRLLSMAYYTGCKIKYDGKPPALLVHACGILRNREAVLFTGPGDAGKTTIGRLCDDHFGQVLNEEMLLVSRPHQDNGTLQVQGVPIIGELPYRLNTVAPLKCVLLLKQSERTAVRRIDRMQACLRFMRQIVIPAYIGQRDRRAIYSLMAEFSDEVTSVTPVYELEFTLDKESLWEVVGELENRLDSRE